MSKWWKTRRIVRSRPKANPTGCDNSGNPLLEYSDPPESVQKAMHALLVRKGLIPDKDAGEEVESVTPH